jgi:cytochrome b561
VKLKNTTDNYGSVAKWIHWSTAALFLVAYATVYFRQWFTEPRTEVNWTALQLHLSIGITIGVLVVLRIIWKFYNVSPALEPGKQWEHKAAQLGHFALYAILVAMPITGYLGTGVATEFFYLFDIPSFKDTALFSFVFGDWIAFEDFEKPIDFVHKEILGAWLVWILIAGHAGAALYHHLVKGDRTLKRMTTGE